MEKSNNDLKMDLIALYENGDYSEARESATRFLAMYPNDGFGWKLYGAVLSRVGNLHEAKIIAYNHKGDIVPNKFFDA